MNAPDVSPASNPATYATVSFGSIALFIVHEAKSRFGVDITLEEAGYAIIGAIAVVHFFAHYLGGKKKAATK